MVERALCRCGCCGPGLGNGRGAKVWGGNSLQRQLLSKFLSTRKKDREEERAGVVCGMTDLKEVLELGGMA